MHRKLESFTWGRSTHGGDSQDTHLNRMSLCAEGAFIKHYYGHYSDMRTSTYA